jgi:hypothetical protein
MSGQIAGLAEITEREEEFAIQSNLQIQAVVGAFENTLLKISASDRIGIIKPWGDYLTNGKRDSDQWLSQAVGQKSAGRP